MMVEVINTNLKKNYLLNSSGPSPQVLVDVSHPERMRSMTTGLCFALLGAVIGLILLVFAYTDKAAGVSPAAAWLVCALFWPPAIILGILYGRKTVRETLRAQQKSFRKKARAERWTANHRVCPHCNESHHVKSFAFTDGQWICMYCVYNLNLLRDHQSICPNCRVITEFRPGEVQDRDYFCPTCNTYVPQGKVVAAE